MRIRSALTAAACVGALCVVGAAHAGDGSRDPDRHADPERRRGAFTVLSENDFYAQGSEDRNYTNGLRFDYLAPEGSGPRAVHAAGRFAAGLLAARDAPAPDTRVRYAVGHKIFTPRDLDREIPDPNDRPYAGFLFGTVSAVAVTANRRLDEIALTVGVAGPWSQADHIQRIYHDAINGVEPRGWRAHGRWP
ncbi:MAG: lipid A-modifier LpxR family protein, partial [Pseudomonadota bacterium]